MLLIAAGFACPLPQRAARMAHAVVYLSLIATTACGGGGGGGSSPTAPSNNTPPPPTLTAVAVSGCTSAESFQCRATASFSNQTTQEVTGQSQWSSSNSAIATVSASGVVSLVASGTFQVRAVYQGTTGSRDLVSSVTPPPLNFAIDGLVKDSSGRPIGSASVVATDSAGTRHTRTADGGGYFHMAPVRSGAVSFSFAAIGFNATTRSVTLTADMRLSDTVLTAVAPPPPSSSMTCTNVPSSAPCGRPTAGCSDGTWSCSQNRQGTCSSHGGVRCWVCPGPLC